MGNIVWCLQLGASAKITDFQTTPSPHVHIVTSVLGRPNGRLSQTKSFPIMVLPFNSIFLPGSQDFFPTRSNFVFCGPLASLAKFFSKCPHRHLSLIYKLLSQFSNLITNYCFFSNIFTCSIIFSISNAFIFVFIFTISMLLVVSLKGAF